MAHEGFLWSALLSYLRGQAHVSAVADARVIDYNTRRPGLTRAVDMRFLLTEDPMDRSDVPALMRACHRLIGEWLGIREFVPALPPGMAAMTDAYRERLRSAMGLPSAQTPDSPIPPPVSPQPKAETAAVPDDASIRFGLLELDR